MSSAEVAEVIEELLAQIRERYVYPEVAGRMEESIGRGSEPASTTAWPTGRRWRRRSRDTCERPAGTGT
jgi:hypothetical protein